MYRSDLFTLLGHNHLEQCHICRLKTTTTETPERINVYMGSPLIYHKDCPFNKIVNRIYKRLNYCKLFTVNQDNSLFIIKINNLVNYAIKLYERSYFIIKENKELKQKLETSESCVSKRNSEYTTLQLVKIQLESQLTTNRNCNEQAEKDLSIMKHEKEIVEKELRELKMAKGIIGNKRFFVKSNAFNLKLLYSVD